MTQQQRHPNVHQPWAAWSEALVLHVCSVYSNPFRYQNRLRSANNFIQHMRESANVRLHMVEVAFGDRPFELTSPDNPDDVQLRTKDVLWIKENAHNIGVARFPDGWKNGACIDCDFRFTRHDWALETVHQLQHYKWVQPYSSYSFMSRQHHPVRIRPSFTFAFHNYHDGDPQRHIAMRTGSKPAPAKDPQQMPLEFAQGRPKPHPVHPHHHPEPIPPRPKPPRPGPPHPKPYAVDNLVDAPIPQTKETTKPTSTTQLIGAPGGAWAFTNESFNAVGGMPDFCVLGAGDWYMAFGFLGYNDPDTQRELKSQPQPYSQAIYRWQQRASRAIQAKIGYVNCMAVHEWHGDASNRQYGTRWEILAKHQFDPNLDLVRDSQGLWRWAGNKPQLEADVMKYFLARDEDSSELLSPTLIHL